MAITLNSMKKNLVNARRSSRVQIDSQRVQHIQNALAQGTSKKALCIIYGLDYDDLKDIRNGRY